MNVKLIAIAALGKRRQIGLAGGLPWSIPDEYRYFRDTVRDQYVLIGRNNFEAHGRDIEGSKPIILTRNADYRTEKGVVLRKMDQVFEFAQKNKIPKVYVIGGAEIYTLTLPFLSEFLWSEVDYDGPADAWFPEFLHLPWNQVSEEKHPRWTMRRLVIG